MQLENKKPIKKDIITEQTTKLAHNVTIKKPRTNNVSKIATKMFNRKRTTKKINEQKRIRINNAEIPTGKSK